MKSQELLQQSFSMHLTYHFFFLSYFFVGKDVAFKSILGSMLFPFFTGIVSQLEPLTYDPLLGAIFGGMLTGIGVGIVYKARGSTGGTSTVAQIIENILMYQWEQPI